MVMTPCCPGRKTTKRILVGGQEVGISDLDGVIAVALSCSDATDDDLRAILIRELRRCNYVPSEAETEYEEAIWHEFQLARKRETTERAGLPEVIVYGTGCDRCDNMSRAVNEALMAVGIRADVVKVTDLEKMVERHIEEAPALSLNGRVVVSGRVPSKEELEDIIRRTLGGARHG